MESNHVQESIIDDGTNLRTGNVAADSYYKAPYDAQVKEIGVDTEPIL